MRKIIIVSDFDGTITEKDSLVEILDKFASPEWRKIARLVKAGRLGTKIGLRRELALCRVSKKAYVNFLSKNIKIDSTFKNFLDFCQKNNFKFLVVSGGFTLNIATLFKKYRVRGIHYHANIITFKGGRVKLKFPYKDKSCRTCSLCKAPFIRRFKSVGAPFMAPVDKGSDKSDPYNKAIEGTHKARPYIIYIGDSVTDRCPARVADLVFAKHHLAEYCKAKGIAYVPYDDFGQIKKYLRTDFLSPLGRGLR